MKTILIVCSVWCLATACSKAPQDNEAEALRQENAVLKAKNAELNSKLNKAEMASTQKDAGKGDREPSDQINSEPPDSFREIAVYADASGEYTMYFILTDKNGRPTTASGKVEVRIKGPLDVYKKDYNITKSDFKIITRGRGALEERVLACVLPRVSKYEFIYDPIQRYGETSGKIYMHLYTRGTLISGEESILFK